MYEERELNYRKGVLLCHLNLFSGQLPRTRSLLLSGTVFIQTCFHDGCSSVFCSVSIKTLLMLSGERGFGAKVQREQLLDLQARYLQIGKIPIASKGNGYGNYKTERNITSNLALDHLQCSNNCKRDKLTYKALLGFSKSSKSKIGRRSDCRTKRCREVDLKH